VIAAVLVSSIWIAAQVSSDPARAVAELQAAIRADPSRESNYTDLGNLLLRTQNFRESVMVLEHARTKFPASAQVMLSLGVAYYGQRRFADSVGSLLDANRLAPEVEQPLVFLGRMLEHAGDRESEIISRFRAFARDNPSNALGWFLVGKAARSEADLRKAVALAPRFGEARFELGSVLQAQRNWAAAAEQLEAAARLSPRDPKPHYRLAQIHDRMGNTMKAEAARKRHAELEAAEKAELDRRQAATRHLEIKTP
jgi:tetratricopeptide (TPR) repeat protein